MQNNVTQTSALDDAIDRVLADLKAMSPEALQQKLEQHRGGMFSQIAQDMEGFSDYLVQNMDDPCVQALCGAMKDNITHQPE